MRTFTIGAALITIWLSITHAQDALAPHDDIFMVSKSVDQFAIKLLETTSKNLNDTYNIALSPYTVWTLMTIIAESAQSKPLRELQNVLVLPAYLDDFRNNYRQNYQELTRNLLHKQNGVHVKIANGIYVTSQYPLNTTFRQISQTVYSIDVHSIDFRNTSKASDIINRYISNATQGSTNKLVSPADITDAEIFITSVLSFKGKWRFPFNKTYTKIDKFYAEDGTSEIGTVEMMYNSAPFPYTALPDLKASIAELPYGDGDKFAMLVLLPAKNEELDTVLQKLSKMDFGDIIDRLAKSAREFEAIDISLPKFTVASEYNLNLVLDQMGITDVFHYYNAKLGGIVPEFLYLKCILQKAVIHVDEGTGTTSTAGGPMAYETLKPKFTANKPFAYFIVDKQTRNIIFEGRLTNPKGT